MNEVENQVSLSSDASPKRPYEAPRIEESGGFETMVLGCLRQRNGTPRAPTGCEGMLQSA
jgi:hypothetical protein